ncbi:MAG TPA: transporter substrate-binding domain-containing protein [Xanthobacteraceae bacterium]|nr:transporter substrate-binding domain-containing protein [Xanthobacteraceae bacterium]
MKRPFAAALLFVLSATNAFAQTPPDRLDAVLKSGELRVGITQDTPPLSMLKPDGSIEGLDIDLLDSLGKAMGVKITLVRTSLADLLASLRDDKFDISFGGGSVTYERAKAGVFSKPYMHIGKLLMIRAADRDKYKSMADLDKPGLKIAYNQGGVNDRFVHANFKAATPVGFTSNALATPALIAGEADAQVSDSTAALYNAKHDPRLALIDAAHPVDPLYLAVFLHRGDEAMRHFIDAWLNQVAIDGTMARIQIKWVGDTSAMVPAP